METSRQEYPALLPSLQPEQAINVLNDRVALINKTNVDIADFLSERRRIEERYVADLRKLARRPHAENASALGVFDMPWQRIVASTETLAQSHETLASKIETDVETPLKQYSTKAREMQSITTIQGNITSIARDLSKAKDKADKLSARGSRKAGDASSNMDGAAREWETQSPYVFEQLQALDEARVNHLRDVLTQFQTHELDRLEKGRSSTEGCLNALLNVEVADEIKTFAAKVSQGRGTSMRRRSSVVTDNRPVSSTGNVPPAPPPPRNHEQRLNSASEQERTSSTADATPHKSKMGGLKRLGTVMRGKKGAAPPPPQSASEKKKDKTRSFAPFRRGDSSRSFQDLEESGRELPLTNPPDRNEMSQRPTTTERPSSQYRIPESVIPTAELNGAATPHKSSADELPAPLIPNSTSTQATQETPQSSQTPASATQPSISSNDMFASAMPESTSTNQGPEEPFRNLTIRDQPIPEDAGEAQLAMNNMANQLRLQAQTSGMSRPQGSVRGRRDVRNTMFVPSGADIPITATSPGPGPLPVTPSTAIPTSASTSSPQTISPSLPAPNRMGSLSEEYSTTSDAGSVHSTQNLSSMAQHPELIHPGLNASIVETVNSWFSEAGVTKSSVVGEVAFSHITAPAVTPQETETIRLLNFQVLEKVAANPAFVTAPKSAGGLSEEQAGTYTVALSSIRRASPTVGLKYQLHLSEANLALYSPILLQPAWQVVEGQASAMILYSLNPAFALPPNMIAHAELVIKNVSITVGLDVAEANSAKAVSAMMAPTQGASFRRKASSVIWRFPELKVKATQERLLVRFVTEGGMPKQGSIGLKFEVPDVTAGTLGVERLSIANQPESDPFADEEENRKSVEGTTESWEMVPTRRMLVSGKYVYM